MKIQYIRHSGFLVEFEHAVLIFDYYKGTFELPDQAKEIYFFASHKHGDHFSHKIFEYANMYDKITFVLSNDIKMNEKYMERKNVPMKARDKIRYARKNEKFELSPDLTVETLKSTDEGVAFLITYKEAGMEEPVVLYHAGDLNWWTWIGETDEEYETMTRAFQSEVKKIEGREIDYAFLPVDPRQEERFFWGFDYFMKKTKTRLAYPMHCWEEYSIITKLLSLPEVEEYKDHIVPVEYCGQILRIE